MFMFDRARLTKASHVGVAALVLGAYMLATRHPDFLASERNLAFLLGLVLLGFLAAGYQTYFLPILLMVFYWAGAALPFQSGMQALRWVMLATGAVLAIIHYAHKGHGIRFNSLHLLALFTALVAFASALVSVNPLLTALKASGLTALFIYAVVGTRGIWMGHPERLITKLCKLCELLVYVSAVCYLASYGVWGNPNSLGLITGVLCWPVLLWQFVAWRASQGWIRRQLSLTVCAFLLVYSLSRAGIVAACFASVLFLVSAKRYRMLFIGSGLLGASLLSAYLLWPSHFDDVSKTVLYKKGEASEGVLGSRRGPWERSIASFQQHPWLGGGFGVAEESADWNRGFATGSYTRERGSSYLAILEGIGVIGAIPLALLLLGLASHVSRTFLSFRLSGNPSHPAIPVALVVAAGMVNAGFEDWMGAVGYHMTVVFWILALSLPDLAEGLARPVASSPAQSRTRAQTSVVFSALR